MLYILECLIFPDFSLLNDLKQHQNFLLKLKVLIYYSIVKLQGDNLARRILELKDVNLALVGVVYAVLMYS